MWLTDFWLSVQILFRRKRPLPVAKPPSIPQPAVNSIEVPEWAGYACPLPESELPSMPAEPVVLSAEEQKYVGDLIGEPVVSDQTYRKYEKKRKKFDKFVQPKGELPVKTNGHGKHPPAEPKAKPHPEIDGVPVPHDYMVDTHHENDSQRVLYEAEELWGVFNFRDTILDQLSRYFVYLQRMRKNDPDAYGLYRQIGAALMPYVSTRTWRGGKEADYVMTKQAFYISPETVRNWHDRLPPYFKQVRSTFGCVAYSVDPLSEKRELQPIIDDKKGELWSPKFLYFHKMEHPDAHWQPMGQKKGDFYAFTVWWDRPHDPKYKRKYGVPQEYGIWISEDGEKIKALKSRKGRQWHDWKYPYDLQDWAKGHHVDPGKYLIHVFCGALFDIEMCGLAQTVRVNVHKGSLTAVFGVNVHRLAYFFKDRDIKLTHKGKRVQIFHFVKPYQRKDGTYVKAHFQGEREFDWAGYHVQLTVPGLHHRLLQTFNYGGVDPKDCDERALDGRQVGQLFADHIKTGEFKKAAEYKDGQ